MKFSKYILILIVLVGLFGSINKAYAETYDECILGYTKQGIPRETANNFCRLPDAPPATPPGSYKLLAPLPDITTFDPAPKTGEDNVLGGYLNLMIGLLIGIAAVMAVVMIVVGGLEYMTSELPGNKEHGKERIRDAIFGLILALGSWALLNTINPDLLNTNIKIETATVSVEMAEQLKIYSGQGTCEPITTGVCSPVALQNAGFTSGEQASSICNGESKGNAAAQSTVDKCSDGKAFSHGLFQINVIAHANEIPGGVCSGVFQVNGSGTQGTCLKKSGSICIEYDCSVKDQAKYQSCIGYITNPTNNITYAKNLKAARSWTQWGAYNSCRSKF